MPFDLKKYNKEELKVLVVVAKVHRVFMHTLGSLMVVFSIFLLTTASLFSGILTFMSTLVLGSLLSNMIAASKQIQIEAEEEILNRKE